MLFRLLVPALSLLLAAPASAQAAAVPPGWLLDAADLDKPGFPVKTFVMSSVEAWYPQPVPALDPAAPNC